MHYYPHNIPDFNNGTRHLTRVERSVYRDAIEMYYDTESPLPSDDFDRLARLLLCRSEEEKGALQLVLDDFFQLRDGAYHHERCDSEIEKYRTSIEAKAKAGKASADARRRKKDDHPSDSSDADDQQDPTDVERVLNGCDTDEQPTKNQELRTKNQITKPSSPPKAPPCKTQEIIELFTDRCPSMIQPRVVPDAVKAMIADRWRQSPEHQQLEFWERFFDYCESLDFLTGRSPPTRGDKPFRVGLEWIVKSGNFAKIINGNYVNG